jgi:CRP-like cAMP-binding protein
MYLVENGWITRVLHMPGRTGQIGSLALAGDFLCVGSLIFERSDQDLIARIEASVFRLPMPDFCKLMALHPWLTKALVWAHEHEEALPAEGIVLLGRCVSKQRLAQVLCKLVARPDLSDRPP